MCLHDRRLAIAVDDQPRQEVALAVHQTVGVVARHVSQTYGNAHLQSRPQPTLPEGFAHLLVVERKHTHGNGAHLIVTNGNEIAADGQHAHHFALADALIHMMNRTRENPRMKALETFLLTLLQIYFPVHIPLSLLHL